MPEPTAPAPRLSLELGGLSPVTVVLDLDGTLVDTAPDLAGTANQVLSEQGRPTVDVATLRPFVGFGARATLAQAFERTGAPASDAALDAHVERFLEIYTARIARESRPFPGALAALDRLAEAGAALAVCTNKREAPARLLLEALGILDRFVAVVGGDTCATRKPDPESLAETLARAGNRARGVMVGDTTADTGAAQAVGIPAIAVSFGYSPDPADSLGAAAVIDHFDALPEAVLRVLERPAAAHPGA